MNKTSIAWTERTWNLVTGCTIDGEVYQAWPKNWEGGER